MPGGRTRGGARRWQDWLGRVLTPEYRDPENPAPPDASATAVPSPGGSDGVDGQASLDQVLRDAAEARGAPGHGNG